MKCSTCQVALVLENGYYECPNGHVEHIKAIYCTKCRQPMNRDQAESYSAACEDCKVGPAFIHILIDAGKASWDPIPPTEQEIRVAEVTRGMGSTW